MLQRFKGLVAVVSLTGVSGLLELLARSRHLKRYGGSFAAMHSVIALEKCGLVDCLLDERGLNTKSHETLDEPTLLTICEYLYENGFLEQMSPHVYRVRSRGSFQALLESAYACLAYLEPVQALDRILRRELQYGRDVLRDDRYDAIASATLTSRFSYAFSWRILSRAEAVSMLDLGCGTGGYLAFLRKRGFSGPLYGLDASEEAIREGRRKGVESHGAVLFAGDLFDVEGYLRFLNGEKLDVLSFMFVLHEFPDRVLEDLLKRIHHVLPGRRILLTELIQLSSDGAKKLSRTVHPELKFVHRLSGQIPRTVEEWKRLLGAAGFEPLFESTNWITNQVCFLFAPR